MSMRIAAALFDHDGTLVDSEGAHFGFWRAVAARHGFDIPPAEYAAKLVGTPTPENAVYLVESRGLALAPEALAAEKEAEARAYLADAAFPLLPGARDALARMRALGLKVAIVTGASRAVVSATIQAHALGELLDAVVSDDDTARGKPHPDPYLRALALLGAEPGEGVAFEDSPPGAASAIAAGLTTVVIPSGPFGPERYPGAAHIAASLPEAIRWTERRIARAGPA